MNLKNVKNNLDVKIQELNQKFVPVHIAIIMDGNGRWAGQRRLGRLRGHRAGINAIRRTVKIASRIGVRYLTLYAFSTENWNRPKREVTALWKLLIEFLDKEVKDLIKQNVKLQIIGRTQQIPKNASDKINWGLDKTRNSTGLNLILALNYGSRDELQDAFNAMWNKKDSIVKPLTKETISDFLYTKQFPDPDLLIRTSGEKRLSNFLLWQLSYAELCFIDVLWPDFDENHFLDAVIDYQTRNRRYGGI